MSQAIQFQVFTFCLSFGKQALDLSKIKVPSICSLFFFFFS